MERLRCDVPLPDEMQGRWTALEQPNSVLMVQGGDINCFGQRVDYDYKVITARDGALTVDLKIDDEVNEDTFQRSNITGLVITPEGDFFVYNVRFACQFERAAG